MKTTKDQNLERVREALFQAFLSWIGFVDITDSGAPVIDEEHTRKVIEDNTFVGGFDPGDWAPEAEVVIYTESGIPSYGECNQVMDSWFNVSKFLGDLYCEPVNGAVVAVYKV